MKGGGGGVYSLAGPPRGPAGAGRARGKARRKREKAFGGASVGGGSAASPAVAASTPYGVDAPALLLLTLAPCLTTALLDHPGFSALCRQQQALRGMD